MTQPTLLISEENELPEISIGKPELDVTRMLPRDTKYLENLAVGLMSMVDRIAPGLLRQHSES